jgi:hypothetical protein
LKSRVIVSHKPIDIAINYGICCQKGVEGIQHKVLMIVYSNTLSNPYAMMIHSSDTPIVDMVVYSKFHYLLQAEQWWVLGGFALLHYSHILNYYWSLRLYSRDHVIIMCLLIQRERLNLIGFINIIGVRICLFIYLLIITACRCLGSFIYILLFVFLSEIIDLIYNDLVFIVNVYLIMGLYGSRVCECCFIVAPYKQ